MSASYCLAYLFCLKGELDLAIPLLERALIICREREFSVWLPQVTGYLGHAYSLAGRIDEGLALLGQAIDVFEATHAWPFRALLMVHRGTAHLLAGRLDSALALGNEALKVAREHGERGHEAWAVLLLGEIASHSDLSEMKKARRPLSTGDRARLKSRHASRRCALPSRPRQALSSYGEATRSSRASRRGDGDVPRAGPAGLAKEGGRGARRVGMSEEARGADARGP